MDSKRRKALRSKLADAAEISPVPVPHNLPEEHLHVAAYFIHEKGKGSQEANWISAVRPTAKGDGAGPQAAGGASRGGERGRH